MILCIGNVLDERQLGEIHQLLDGQQFSDGSRTAGWAAQGVKRNEQLSPDSSAYKRLQSILTGALERNEVFVLATAPRVIRPIVVSRYSAGMGYGNHVDNALMGGQQKSRADISFTLFLSNENDYEGGELVLDEPSGERKFKLQAGEALVYASTALHRVEPVRSGERLVAVGWIQSYVRSAEQRAILFDLETARHGLFHQSGKTIEFDLLSKSTSNLWRMWSDA